ncbi:MAG: DUF4340 domain-containing protein [Bdellovibrionales bacterium]|nr:DUF4340 domain-containing protein [Bdellovibrionales bacterium]
MKPKYKSLSLVVVAFVATAIWLYISEKQQKDHLLQESLIFKDRLNDCREIEIKTSEISLKLLKKNDRWEITSPIQDLASPAGVRALLKPIQSQQYQKLETNKPKSAFGLDQPQMSFEARCSNRDYKLMFSKQLGPSKNHYIYSKGELYVGNFIWKNLFDINLSYLRESYILSSSIEDIKKITYFQKELKQPIEIELIDQKWVSKNNPINTKQVNKYLKGLENLSSQSFYSNFISKKILSQTNLISPILKISIEYQDGFENRNWKLALGESQGHYYVTTSSRNPIFEISTKDAKNMLWSISDFKESPKKEVQSD